MRLRDDLGNFVLRPTAHLRLVLSREGGEESDASDEVELLDLAEAGHCKAIVSVTRAGALSLEARVGTKAGGEASFAAHTFVVLPGMAQQFASQLRCAANVCVPQMLSRVWSGSA